MFSMITNIYNNSIKVGPLVFLLYMFVIMENIMKRPVLNCSTETQHFTFLCHILNLYNMCLFEDATHKVLLLMCAILLVFYSSQ